MRPAADVDEVVRHHERELQRNQQRENFGEREAHRVPMRNRAAAVVNPRVILPSATVSDRVRVCPATLDHHVGDA